MGKRALVIEDNDDNMELITYILEVNGFQTIRAASGRDGLERARADTPDFVLLDIQLPDMDGTEVLAALRNSPATRDLPIIAVTSYAMSGDRERLLRAGCTGYIEKPIDPERVMEQIGRLLAQQP
ncbi:MAG: response regulator [Gammaproteobacteria bacterium]